MEVTIAHVSGNRIDEVVTFNYLTKDDMAKIVDIQLQLIKKRLRE